MAKCDICGKGAHFGNNVSHSHRRSNRIWNSNVKNVKCKVNGASKKLHVCTNCLKSGRECSVIYLQLYWLTQR